MHFVLLQLIKVCYADIEVEQGCPRLVAVTMCVFYRLGICF